jgi:hypothetical protein
MSTRTKKDMTGAREGARGERRRRRRRAAAPVAPVAPATGGEALALQAELVLLREENARLKAAGHQEPDLGALLDRARSLPAGGAGADDRADEAAQLLVEGMVMRESLLGLCQEIGRSMAALEARLAALGGATVAAGEGA